jgi:hypothetical protein
MGMFLIQALVDEAEWVRDSKGTGSYDGWSSGGTCRMNSADRDEEHRRSHLPARMARPSPCSVSAATSPAPRRTRSSAPGKPSAAKAGSARFLQSRAHQLQRHRAHHSGADGGRQNRAQGSAFGLTRHFQEVLTMVGIVLQGRAERRRIAVNRCWRCLSRHLRQLGPCGGLGLHSKTKFLVTFLTLVRQMK